MAIRVLYTHDKGVHVEYIDHTNGAVLGVRLSWEDIETVVLHRYPNGAIILPQKGFEKV